MRPFGAFGPLGFWTFGLMDIQAFGLLGFWTFFAFELLGLGFWAFDLSDFWSFEDNFMKKLY